MNNNHPVNHILASYEDEGVLFLKGEDINEISKGRTAKPIGSKETWGGKEYIKTANGWKPVGKNSGAAKQAHDFVHDDKTVIGKTKSGKNIHDTYDHKNHKDFTAQDHLDASDQHMKVMSDNSTKHSSTYHDEHSASHYRAYEKKKKEEDENKQLEYIESGKNEIANSKDVEDWWHNKLSLREQKALGKKYLESYEYEMLLGNKMQYTSSKKWQELKEKVYNSAKKEIEDKGKNKVEKSNTVYMNEFQKSQAAKILGCYGGSADINKSKDTDDKGKEDKDKIKKDGGDESGADTDANIDS